MTRIKKLDKCSASLAIRRMQVKRHHSVPTRIAGGIPENTKGWQGRGGLHCPSHCWGDCSMVQHPRQTLWQFLKQYINPIRPSSCIPGHLSQRNESLGLHKHPHTGLNQSNSSNKEGPTGWNATERCLWRNPVSKGYILYDSSIEHSPSDKTEMENRLAVAG